MSNEIFWCKKCLNMSTRPRIEFQDGICNACLWAEEKKTLDWSKREQELKNLLNKYRSKDGGFDCITTVSGGKDGSYVTYMLKHKYKMNPLAVTIRPALEREEGQKNLNDFCNSGYNHILFTIDSEILRKLNKLGFIEMGFPYYGWLIAITSTVYRIAANFNIPLMFYGEDGEVEHGGSSKTKNTGEYDLSYIKNIYFESGYEKVLNKAKEIYGLTEQDLHLFKFPDFSKHQDLKMCKWGYYEPWDSHRNYEIAKKFCGLTETKRDDLATFKDYVSNDSALFVLHAYLMYLKFGFGRATADANDDIRTGRLTREEAISLVEKYDRVYPSAFIDEYLGYYQMTKSEFDAVLDKWANKNLFEKDSKGIYQPRFHVGQTFKI